MVRITKRLELAVPEGTKNRYPEGLRRGSNGSRVWYSVVAERSVMRKKRDDSETFEDLVLGVISDSGFLCWVPAYTVNIREDINGELHLRMIEGAIEALKRINPIFSEGNSILDTLPSLADKPLIEGVEHDVK